MQKLGVCRGLDGGFFMGRGGGEGDGGAFGNGSGGLELVVLVEI